MADKRIRHVIHNVWSRIVGLDSRRFRWLVVAAAPYAERMGRFSRMRRVRYS